MSVTQPPHLHLPNLSDTRLLVAGDTTSLGSDALRSDAYPSFTPVKVQALGLLPVYRVDLAAPWRVYSKVVQLREAGVAGRRIYIEGL